MKRILFSLGAILVVGGLVAGGTLAFYSDTETSTGNSFTAGTIDLIVDSFGATYNGEKLEGLDWIATDLTREKFFVFDDVKPGDYGRRSVSVHVSDNPAYACLLISDKNDQENDLVEPEDDAGDRSLSVGELSQNLELFIWEDFIPDGNYDPDSGEPVLLTNGDFAVDSFFDISYAVMYDSESTDTVPFVQGITRNYGMYWCAGNLSVDTDTGEISCDGSGMGDVAQTDSFDTSVVLYAEQIRNNPEFTCAEVELSSAQDQG